MRRLLVTMACAIVLTFVGKANAAVWLEVDDAGDLPGTAQVTSGANPLDSISGSIGFAGDVDMYQIYLSNPASFSATTVGGTTLDTQLFLFNSIGNGVYSNDDSVGLRSTLPAGHALSPTTPGNYYLAISVFNKEPLSAGGLIFTDFISGANAPTGPGASNPVNAWTISGGSTTGDYRISLTGAEFVPTPVPEPSTMLLLGSGLAGLVGYGRKRFKK